MNDRARFVAEVMDPIRVPFEGRKLGLAAYLALPKAKRSGDEAAVVDELFTPRLLKWLGYSDDDWVYNRAKESERDRPDFRVVPNGSAAFVVENKCTAEDFDLRHLKQMRRYVAGTTAYALWTNARTIVAVRFLERNTFELLLELHLPQDKADPSEDVAASGFAFLHLLFRRDRYVDLPGILDRIAVSEDEWERGPISAPGASQDFIDSTKTVLAEIASAAKAQVEQAEIDARRSRTEAASLSRYLKGSGRKLLDRLKGLNEETRRSLGDDLVELLRDPTTIDTTQVASIRPERLAKADAAHWRQWAEDALTRIVAMRDRNLPRTKLQRIATAFEVWKERYRIIEDEGATEDSRRQAYAEQVAYTFFVRLLLARILEDRHILPRLISDGGLRDWRTFLRSHFNTDVRPAESAHLMPEALLALLYRSVSRYYRHFFSQPVFDWFEPDDYLLATALEKLSRYDFAEIQQDILGFTYEAYIDEVARARKGHFLTPGGVVELMLDQAGYRGREVIGKRVIDTAVGSGSFLVHSARRLRQAICDAECEDAGGADVDRRKVARTFIASVQRDLVGMEINPFSCYLSELNLFIQVLDDLVYLWKECRDFVEVERFQIFNTNSLELPRRILLKNEELLASDEVSLDEGWEAKRDGEGTFHFVVGNPPYVNRGIISGAPSYQDIPFYRDVLLGDQNTYLLFLKLATYYCAPGGVVSQVVPINVLGDASSQKFRRLYSSEKLHVESITRFYRRQVLFDGVLQRVCVLTARAAPISLEREYVAIGGGRDIDEATPVRATVPRSWVVAATPDDVSTRWSNGWLVSPDSIHYDIWRHLRGSMVGDVDAWTRGKLKFQKGDVNKTRTKVFRTEVESDRTIPITCADNVENFGPWERDVWIDPRINPARAGLRDSALADARRELDQRIVRVATLRRAEYVFALKDIVGMEAIRPLRGAIWERSSEAPFLLDDTLQIAFPLAAEHNTLAAATFGLLVSAVPSYMLQLFSTNAHATREEILRTPVPKVTSQLATNLAHKALATQAAGTEFHRLLRASAGELKLAEVTIDAREFLSRLSVSTVAVDDAVRNGLLTRPVHSDWKVNRLWSQGELSPIHEGAFADAVKLLLPSVTESFAAGGRLARLPDPHSSARFILAYQEAAQKCGNAYWNLLRSRAELDEIVFSMYEIRRESWQRAIMRGMPWSVEGREELRLLEGELFNEGARRPRRVGLGRSDAAVSAARNRKR